MPATCIGPPCAASRNHINPIGRLACGGKGMDRGKFPTLCDRGGGDRASVRGSGFVPAGHATPDSWADIQQTHSWCRRSHASIRCRSTLLHLAHAFRRNRWSTATVAATRGSAPAPGQQPMYIYLKSISICGHYLHAPRPTPHARPAARPMSGEPAAPASRRDLVGSRAARQEHCPCKGCTQKKRNEMKLGEGWMRRYWRPGHVHVSVDGHACSM